MIMAEGTHKCIFGQSLTDRDFLKLSGLIHSQCGIKMPPSKKTMLEARLRKRLRALGMHSFSEYCAYLFSPAGVENELPRMINAVTTNKTDFFREPLHFQYLHDAALPDVLGRKGERGRRVMVWSAGCSTGEEPYTLAMVLNEFAEKKTPFAYLILATDICTDVLEKAETGIYEEERVGPVPPELRKKYFMRSRDRTKRLVRIVPELRAVVRFRRLNFMDTDFGLREPVDIIFCRNVIIYFDRQTQERLINRLAGHLAAGGYLFMGHSETLHGMDTPLLQVAPTIYRKVER